MGFLNQIHRLLDCGQVLQAQKVHLQQADGLNVFHRVLGNHRAAIAAPELQRHDFIQGIGGDHYPCRVHANGFVCAFDADGHI